MLRKVLDRLTYGAIPTELEYLEKIGLTAYIQEQLQPDENDDSILQKKLANFVFEGKENPLKGRKFEYLNASLEELWPLTKDDKTLSKEGQFPAAEVIAATWLRGIHSKWQLRERLVEFWHNHFNISIETDERIATVLPLYDKTVRMHCLGNFRNFLEAIAKSQAMLIYLDNAVSRASPANENYARELFELHTLGADHYSNHLYSYWKDVPKSSEGIAQTYIDEDVYEAARAFSGWTLADGEWMEGGDKPNTGEFMYIEGWHDHYQKRILGVEFRSHQGPLEDGQKVLDLVAYHPATAKYLARKLCTYFVADDPPESIVEKVSNAWIKHCKDEQQIKKVLEVLLLSEEFKAGLGTKVKRPFGLVVSAVRALELEFKPNQHLHWLLRQMGYRHFSWPTPTGHPDTKDYWINSDMLLKRWNIMPSLFAHEWHDVVAFDVDKGVPASAKSCRQLVEYWVEKILGDVGALPENVQNRLRLILAEGKSVEEPPVVYNANHKKWKFKQMILLILMAPVFQYR